MERTRRDSRDREVADDGQEEVRLSEDGVRRGVWDSGLGRADGEEWAGVEDLGAIRVGVRVQGGPWAMVECDVLSVTCLVACVSAVCTSTPSLHSTAGPNPLQASVCSRACACGSARAHQSSDRCRCRRSAFWRELLRGGGTACCSTHVEIVQLQVSMAEGQLKGSVCRTGACL